MRAVRHTEHGVEVLDVGEPALTATDDGVRVRVRAASICGSDLHMLAYGPSPFTLGHEFAGFLDDGTAVAVDPSGPCGECDQCTIGRGHLCRTAAERVLGIGLDGGMADECVVARRAIVPLATTVRPEDACLVEPLGIAVHGLALAGVDGGQRVAVVGAGSIGLGAVAAARASGSEVGLVARHDAQRLAGERLGATTVSGEYDVVVEAAGTESALAQAAELCRPSGTVLFLSTHWTPVPIPGMPAALKELAFRWSFMSGNHAGGRDLDIAAALLARDPEIAATLITHRFPLEDAAEAFRVAADRSSGAIKVAIEPG
jgi:L-iditol 2-dehydrogenase